MLDTSLLRTALKGQKIADAEVNASEDEIIISLENGSQVRFSANRHETIDVYSRKPGDWQEL